MAREKWSFILRKALKLAGLRRWFRFAGKILYLYTDIAMRKLHVRCTATAESQKTFFLAFGGTPLKKILGENGY